MPIQFTNTLSRSLETFSPLDPAGKTVRIYTCGPTVYSYAHIGNCRAYVFEDLLQRHLENRGYDVLRVLNMTDVDDKTIRNSRAAGVPLADFTAVYKQAFLEDLATLNIEPATYNPSATEPRYIAKMIEMIGELLAKGIAYQADDRSIYFRLSKFPNYGKLAHLNLEELRPTGRIQNDEYEKESIGDFALWKAWDAEDGDVKWESPWGPGRPGWHIECSAMAISLLGPELDIHCGGVDNIFPHHEAEIAQSECCTGQTFSKYWMHCTHLMVEGQKMSKSAGNFYTLRDLLEKGWTGREVRYALLSVNYLLPLNFTCEGLEAARKTLQRIDNWVRRVEELAIAPADETIWKNAVEFHSTLDHDLNISGALGHLFVLINESNARMDAGQLTSSAAASLLQAWESMNRVLAITKPSDELPQEIAELLAERNAARLEKNWPESDRLRDLIQSKGWAVKDSKAGTKLTKL
ncbi:MAG: cysteine--tRNA ligase [Chthoniobacterales bacterium]